MRREELFSHCGFYGFLIESNVLLHREAAQAAIAAFRPVVETWRGHSPVPVLDLACGGWPVTIAEAMAAFSDNAFDYTGVDINPDQVALATRRFPFPANVVAKCLIEGNAWVLDELDVGDAYPLIFSGVNLHHGTPEEIGFLGLQVRDRLAPKGVFFSHDVYRPDREPYRSRPEWVDGASTHLVSPQRLAAAGLPEFPIIQDLGEADPAWRVDYLRRMQRALIERGGDPAGVESTARHMRNRDYPISTRELRVIMESLGLRVQVRRYDDTAEPLGPFVATCIIKRSET